MSPSSANTRPYSSSSMPFFAPLAVPASAAAPARPAALLLLLLPTVGPPPRAFNLASSAARAARIASMNSTRSRSSRSSRSASVSCPSPALLPLPSPPAAADADDEGAGVFFRAARVGPWLPTDDTSLSHPASYVTAAFPPVLLLLLEEGLVPIMPMISSHVMVLDPNRFRPAALGEEEDEDGAAAAAAAAAGASKAEMDM